MIQNIALAGKIALPFAVLCSTLMAFRMSGYHPSNDSTSQPCEIGVRQGLIIYLKDAATGAPITKNARITVTDGKYTRALVNPGAEGRDVVANPNAFIGVPERDGTYVVHVTCPGYISQTRDDVVVTREKCHVNTTTFEMSLSPQ